MRTAPALVPPRRYALPWSAWGVGVGLFLALGGRWLVQGGVDLALAEQIQDTGALHEFVATLAQVLSGVLGFTISVVAIVVQLSADRFTPKVTELFLREKVNFYIIFFLILANVVSLWSSMALSIYERPALLIGLNLVLGTASFLVLIPYFNFVFNFLQPASIIHRIEEQVQQAVLSSLGPEWCPKHAPKGSPSSQSSLAHQRCLSALDEIKGIATSAIRQQEGIILLDALDSLKAFWLFYAARKEQLPRDWFLLTPALRRDPDFVSVDEGLLRQIETEGSWVELKILRQYQALFGEGLNGMRQVSTLVAIHSRELGIRALQTQKLTVAGWVVKFFNTYLRAVINTQDIRTGYNLLKQYRMVAEAALRQHHHALVLEIVGHFRYYSLIAYKAGLFFLSETFGFDLGLLVQLSCALQSETTEAILQVLLRLDQDPESEQQETTLRGIRKTQVRLAAYFLSCGREDLAKLIYLDMHHEPLVRLQIIRQELQSTTAEFWEFTDRGENFYYLDPALQPYADQFFGWFQGFVPEIKGGQGPVNSSGQGSLELP
ncbi:MAG: DUF2254 family protein [Thermostichus sp. BF3_bins_97]